MAIKILILLLTTLSLCAQTKQMGKVGFSSNQGHIGWDGLSKHTSSAPSIPDYRQNLIASWWADSNWIDATDWQSVIDTLTLRWEGVGIEPVYEPTVLNGYGGIRFRGDAKFDFTELNLADWTIVMVYANTTNLDNYIISNTSIANGVFVSLNALGYGVSAYDGTDIRATEPLATDYMIVAVMPNKILINGTEASYLATGTVGALTLNELGGRSSTAFYFDGRLVSIRIYDINIGSNATIVSDYYNTIFAIY